MRSTVSSAFLILYLVVSTEAHEIFLLPLLIGHFQEHKAHNQDLSFTDFISNHYLADVSGDDHEHEKLPFKHNHTEQQLSPTVSLPAVVEISTSFYIERLDVFIHKDDFILNSLTGSIWQPPRLS